MRKSISQRPNQTPSLTLEQAVKVLGEQMEAGVDLTQYEELNSDEVERWMHVTESRLIQVFGNDSPHVSAVLSAGPAGIVMTIDGSDYDHQGRLRKILQARVGMLADVVKLLKSDHPPIATAVGEKPDDLEGATEQIERIVDRFDIVAKQLRLRYMDRPTLDVGDEYDVQDLLHALLRLFFDDVRPEETTPSYAGGSSRIDFLLKEHQMGVEVKMARKSLGAKELGAELIIDIGRYKAHQDCKTLVCFVYDPVPRIVNPRGIERDLTRQHDGLDVRVFIRPR